MHADRGNESDESEGGEGVSRYGTLDDEMHKMHGDMVMHKLCSDIQEGLARDMNGIDARKVKNMASSACFRC